jgi:hypothetical protein
MRERIAPIAAQFGAVTADVAGAVESPVYAILRLGAGLESMRLPEGYTLDQHTASQPSRAIAMR